MLIATYTFWFCFNLWCIVWGFLNYSAKELKEDDILFNILSSLLLFGGSVLLLFLLGPYKMLILEGFIAAVGILGSFVLAIKSYEDAYFAVLGAFIRLMFAIGTAAVIIHLTAAS